MNDIMKPSNTFLITLKDWVFDPEGPNGGGENATRSVAEELAKMGYRVIVAGNLAGPERKILGVEYWQLGPAYDLYSLMQRTKEIGIFDLLAVERATSLVAFHKYPLCRNRYLYYHGPTADAAGLQFSTCSLNADRIFCVSKAQKERLLQGGADESKVQVLRNAVDTTLFRFEDFSQRDPFKLVFAGVLIFEKGIHVLLNIFPRLKEIFPQLTLDVYGRKGGWTLIDNNISQMEQGIPGLKFKGEVPQATLAQAFQKAAVCVIPSTSFETCSLVSIDAQACGCPVVAFGMGAIPEFIHDGRTGVVIKEVSEQQLFENLRLLLSNPDKLREMNRECRELAGKRTWTDVAKELLSGVEQVRKQELVTVHAEDAAPRITAVNQ
ncbi:MAG: glycosyltransferase family 4 protein, partial [Deltaproteobacteria bacterium]|nr:glycosyltransferase family 4 protein [Deltaproteobacteria bacterium]